MSDLDYVLLALRLWAGIVMVAHGINHGRNLEGTTRWMAKVGLRSPELNARLSFLTEIAIGLGLIAGLLTAPAAAGLVATMAVAFWTVHRFAGFFVFHRPDEGYEYVVTLALVAVTLAVIGPGEASLDAVLGIEMTGSVGALIAAAGLVVAAGQLATFWRRPV